MSLLGRNQSPSTDRGRVLRDLPAFAHQPWQMSYGERTIIEGVLAMVEPRLSIEIGRAEGGSLRRIAEHSGEVISFDIVEPSAELAELPNVRMFSGDSHVLLPRELSRLAEDGQQVDFVLVDGDHTTGGVRRDMQDLLDSPAIANTVILAHDTLNEEVRLGLEEVDYDAHEKVGWVDLDFIPGYVARIPERLGECWGGIGLVVVDASGSFRSGGPRHGETLFDQTKLVWPAAQWIRAEGPPSADQLGDITLVADGLLADAEQESAALAAERTALVEERSALAAELERHRAWLRGIEGSASWRLTSPLRALKRGLRERRIPR
jgi:hypothetical protein